MTTYEAEHVHDPADFADAMVLLDDGEALIVAECACCLRSLTVCVCNTEKPPEGFRMPRPFGTRYFGHTERPAPEVDR